MSTRRPIPCRQKSGCQKMLILALHRWPRSPVDAESWDIRKARKSLMDNTMKETCDSCLPANTEAWCLLRSWEHLRTKVLFAEATEHCYVEACNNWRSVGGSAAADGRRRSGQIRNREARICLVCWGNKATRRVNLTWIQLNPAGWWTQLDGETSWMGKPAGW